MVRSRLSWLRRAGSALYRIAYGKPLYQETWTFPPGSLRTAREALGLDELQAYELAPIFGAGWQHVLYWSGMDKDNRPIRITDARLAVLISTGMAIHARQVGSQRSIADLILFGPAPLSHYPPISPVRVDRLDAHDVRRLGHALTVLRKALQQLKYHDATVVLSQRLAQASAELETWFDG